MKRWKSIYREANIFGEFKKILSPIGFRNPDIKDIIDMFKIDYQDLDYKGIMNDLIDEWDINQFVAESLYQVAKKLKII